MNKDQKIGLAVIAIIVLFSAARPLVPILRCANGPDPALTVSVCADLYTQGIVR